MSLLRLFPFALLLAGCATIHPRPAVQTFGDSDPERDQAIIDAITEGDPEDVPKDVRVLAGEIPEGLDLVEEGTKLVVREGYGARYEVLGSVTADYTRATENAILKNTYWTWDYQEGWRKGYCYWQIPLKIATLGIWSYLVPLHYPCFASAPSDESERRIALQNLLKRAAKQMGGNLVLLTASGDLFYVTGNRNHVQSGTVKNVALKAFIIRDNSAAIPVGDASAAVPVGDASSALPVGDDTDGTEEAGDGAASSD